VPLAEFAYNKSVHEAVGASPLFLNNGLHPVCLVLYALRVGLYQLLQMNLHSIWLTSLLRPRRAWNTLGSAQQSWPIVRAKVCSFQARDRVAQFAQHCLKPGSHSIPSTWGLSR